VPQSVVSVRVYPGGRMSSVGSGGSGMRSGARAGAVSAMRFVPRIGAFSGGSCGSGLAQLSIRDKIGNAFKGARRIMIVAI
jgi:hypothetical protein